MHKVLSALVSISAFRYSAAVMFVDGGKQFSILSEDLNTTLCLHLHISLSVLQNRM